MPPKEGVYQKRRNKYKEGWEEEMYRRKDIDLDLKSS